MDQVDDRENDDREDEMGGCDLRSEVPTGSAVQCVPSKRIQEFVVEILVAAGTDPAPAQSVAAALTGASLRGIDSHGLRLLLHYAKVVRSGRINPSPKLSFHQTGPSAGIANGDNGFGHFASFFAIEQGIALARETGISAVSVINSSHFGAAGTYVLHAANQGYAALGVSNSDPFVLAHGSVYPFHGTNPLAFAAPNFEDKPYLVDMATSAVTWNKVQDLIARGLPLPEDVSVDKSGEQTTDPTLSAALLPLGGVQFGFKGAALASMIEVLSAVMTGSPHCSQIPGMPGPDLSSHRRMGHFFIVIDPNRFVSAEVYRFGMRAYLHDLRNQESRSAIGVMAPGDREWAIEEARLHLGIPIPDQLRRELDGLADCLMVRRLIEAV